MPKINKRNLNLATRPILERMARIRAKLDAEKSFNALTLARELEVSRKTINRDLEFMRDRLGYTIEYSPEGRTYKGSAPIKPIL